MEVIMVTRRSTIGTGAATLALAALALTGGPSPATAQMALKFSLDWRFEGPAAGYFVALDKGYYAQEGLDVTIDSGQGSLEAIPRVASGTYQMGFADINSLIKFRDQNPTIDVRGVMMVYDKPPFSIVTLARTGIAQPRDLEGKVLGAPAADGAFAQWKAFVHENGIDAESVTIENVGFPLREPMLADGSVDAITGFSFSSFLNLKGAGVPEDEIVVLLMADHGLDLYGNVIIVNPDFARDHPDAVKGFLRATIRGWQDTVADPVAAVEHVLSRNPVVTREVELERLQMCLDQNVVTPWVQANGFGGIDPDRLARSIEQIALTYDYTNKPTPDLIFTDAFLPPAAERMLR
jgi:NitT/TauT family transport system substrate-binding protein